MKTFQILFALICAAFMPSSSSAKEYDSIAIINYNQEIQRSSCIVLATLKLESSPDENKKIYLIDKKKTLKGILPPLAFLAIPINVDSSEGNPPDIQEKNEYLLFLKNPNTSPLNIQEKIYYSLTGNWKGILSTTRVGAENRAAANVLKIYKINLYDDMPSFLQAIEYGISSSSELKNLPPSTQKIVEALNIKPSPESGLKIPLLGQ